MKRAGVAFGVIVFMALSFLYFNKAFGSNPFPLIVPFAGMIFARLFIGNPAAFFKGQRGQVSIEIVLVTGAIFLIVISVLPYISDSNTVNKGVSAARDGATFAQTMLNMGYTAGNATLSRGEKVRIDDISYSMDTTSSPGTKIVSITLTISGTSDAAVGGEIVSQAANSIYYAYNGQWNTNTNGTVNTGDYRFVVGYTFA